MLPGLGRVFGQPCSFRREVFAIKDKLDLSRLMIPFTVHLHSENKMNVLRTGLLFSFIAETSAAGHVREQMKIKNTCSRAILSSPLSK